MISASAAQFLDMVNERRIVRKFKHVVRAFTNLECWVQYCLFRLHAASVESLWFALPDIVPTTDELRDTPPDSIS
jgi:hypothetical protein